MEVRIRRSTDRGTTETEWLTSRHTFSFNRYRDQDWEKFHVLRVLNEDTVKPCTGFDMHSHSNMEILTYVMNGKLKHVDSTGTEGTVEAGDMQRMTAGTGVLHSEYNVSETEPLHFYQVWITPRQHGLEPGYETVTVPEGTGLQLIAAPMEKEEAGAAAIHQDAAVYRGQLPREESLSYEPGTERAVWIQVVDGDLTVADTWLEEGDGIGIGDVEQIVLRAETNTSFLLFDVPTG